MHRLALGFGVLRLSPDLLAPGDGKSASLSPLDFTWTAIRSAEHPLFAPAYEALWAEFGAAHELETRGLLAARFLLGGGLRYEMLGVQKGDQLIAVRDHTAIWIGQEVVVHLSHVLLAPEWRRSGLAGWLRAAPILLAREVADDHGEPEAPITLVAEMEYAAAGADPKQAIRLAAYERAGYRKVDPRAVRYHQPDFRPPEVIDQSGGSRPLPFQLIVRVVGREGEPLVTGAQLRQWVRALYTLYGSQFRAEDMAHPLLDLEDLPAAGAQIPLLPPTAL